MKTYVGSIFCFAFLLAFLPTLHGQAVYTAERSSRITIGGGVSRVNTDYAPKMTYGPSLFADIDLFRHLGLEAEGHFGGIVSPDDIGENSYLAGPRAFIRHSRFTGYAKILVGRGIISNQRYNLSSSYNLYALGGGLEYRAGRKISVRAVDFEMQKWPDFYPHSLSPVIITVGASYIIR